MANGASFTKGIFQKKKERPPPPEELPQRLRTLTDFLNSLLPATYNIIDTRNSGINRAVRVRAPGNLVPLQKHRPPCSCPDKGTNPLDSPTPIHVHAHMLLTIKDIYGRSGAPMVPIVLVADLV